MTTTDASTEERLSRLEGAYEHLATKADVAEVKAEIARVDAKIETKFAELQAIMERRFATQTRWFVGSMLSGMAFMSVLAFGVARLIE